MALSVNEKIAVQESWKIVCENVKENGAGLFIALFTAHPEYMKLFKKFDGLSIEELKTSAILKAHGTTVMHSLTALVENLDDPDTLVILLQEIATRHHPRGVRGIQYQDLFTVVAAFLKEKLGDVFSGDTASGWTKVVATMSEVITARMEELSQGASD